MTKAEKLWNFIRWTKRFNREDLLVTTGCAATHAGNYLSLLIKAGYVRATATERDPAGRRRKIYELVRDTGVKEPRMVVSLYDPNTGDTFAFNSKDAAPLLPGPKKGVRKCGSRS